MTKAETTTTNSLHISSAKWRTSMGSKTRTESVVFRLATLKFTTGVLSI